MGVVCIGVLWGTPASADVSGTLYQSNRTTAYTTPVTITMAVATTTVSTYSTTTLATGAYWFSLDLSTVATGTPVTIFVNGEAGMKAVTVTETNGSSTITNLALYQNHVTIRNEGGTGTTTKASDLVRYDSSDDADIQFTVATTTPQFTVVSTQTLYVASSTVFQIDLPTTTGDFETVTTATALASSSLNLSGNYVNNGTFSSGVGALGARVLAPGEPSNAGVVTFSGTSKTISGNLTGTSAFYSMVIDGTYSITATDASTTDLIIGGAGSLTAPTTLSIYGNFNNSGTFINNSGILAMENLRGEVLRYLAGRDSSGNNTGTGNSLFYDFAISGTTLYIGTSANATACSQVAGSAIGCELKVFDISSTTNPVYVAGRDVSGSATGTGNVIMRELLISGTTLYVSQLGNATACSQTAGSATGCELKVFDISSTTNPIYVAGRDASGSAAGTGNATIGALALSGTMLYVGQELGSATACSQTAGSAIGCELKVFDISSSTNPIYLAGRDVSGSAAGTGNAILYDLAISETILYVSQAGNATACSQTAGSAIGCELKAFDISSSTNPIYRAGRDISGNSTGTGTVSINALTISGTTLYVGTGGNVTACSQTAGSAIGCEIQVYDIASTTNPIYVAGRDASGSSVGTDTVTLRSIITYGTTLYVGQDGNATACSQVAGGAIGCELKVFDISSTTYPVYIAGQDASGDSTGTGALANYNFAIIGTTLYVAQQSSATACSQTAGSAIGCELKVFDTTIAGTIRGNLTATSSLGIVALSGITGFINNATTNSLVILSGTSTLPQGLTVTGDYTNLAQALFADTGTLYLDSTSAQAIGGTLVGNSALPNTILSSSGIKTFTDHASTSALTVATGATLSTSNAITVAGALINDGSIEAGSNLWVAGDFTNTGSFQAGTDLSITGDYINTGTFTANGGTTTIETYIIDYLAGEDASGDSVGTGFATINSIAVSGTTLYIGTSANATACSQVAGGAIGCELKVFDISSSTNPIYRAGRDVSGSSTGTDSLIINTLTISGTALYVGTGGNVTACSQTAGSAIGCEIQVYDISSTTNPIYVAGRDANGDSSGASNVTVYTLATANTILYVGISGNIAVCSQVAGISVGCELEMYDISSTTNPVYVAGMDSSGNTGGSSFSTINTLTISGTTLYVGTGGDATACSQNAGSAFGCELQVYDIASTTNPIYRAGRDVIGNSTGTGNLALYSLVVFGTTLYTGQAGSATACSQTAGSAIGCELKAFDISSTTNPTYVAGRDVTGDSTGIGNLAITSLASLGATLYTGQAGNVTACSQVAGSAIGCELKVFAISSTTNPVYMAGRDVSGSTAGASNVFIYSLFITGSTLYTGTGGNITACSQVAGSAVGCELQGYMIAHTLSGDMTSTSTFGTLNISGNASIFANDVTATNLTINPNATVVAPTQLTINSNFTNNGAFIANAGTVSLEGANHTLSGDTTFYNLFKTPVTAATTTFAAGSLTTVEGDWFFNGQSGAIHKLRSSVPGEYWYINPMLGYNVDYTDVKDSYNTNVSAVICDVDCIDSGHNVNWTISTPSEQILFTSETAPHFYVGQATTTLPAFIITETTTPVIATTTDIRITIATTSSFRFDTSVTTLTFGDTAASKVVNPVTYEDGGATVVINVTTAFAASDILSINGLAVGSFTTVASTTSAFILHTDGDIIGASTASDLQSTHITGSLVVGEHGADQVTNQFDFQNHTTEPLFAFALTANNEVATVTDMVVTLSGIQNLDTTDLTNFKLYRDTNVDGLYDGGDLLIDGAGILTITGQHGAVTFSQDFVASTTASYLVTADLTTIPLGAAANFSLNATSFTTLGQSSLYSLVPLVTVNQMQHYRRGGGAGSGAGRVTVPGASVETGGEAGAGHGAGEEADGENIAADPDFYQPTTTGSPENEWTNGSNALLSDGTYATAASAGLRQGFAGFVFNIPSTNTIQGIALKLDASGTTATGTIDVALSWDAGASFTTVKATPTLVGTDVVYLIGGASDLWGRTWSASEFSTTNFRLRVTAQPVANTIRLDALELRVYHQMSGGGGGGGGRS